MIFLQESPKELKFGHLNSNDYNFYLKSLWILPGYFVNVLPHSLQTQSLF